MANITVGAFNPIHDNAQVPPRLLTAPVAVDMAAGTPVKFNATTGKFEAMASTDAPHLFAGLIIKSVKAGRAGSAFRGLAYMEGATGNVGTLISLGTAGVLTDTQTGKVVARIVPMHESGGTFKKLVEIFELPITVA